MKNKKKNRATFLVTMVAGILLFTTACRNADESADAAEPAIDRQTAMQNASERIEDVFSTSVDAEQLSVKGGQDDWYTVDVDRADGEGFDYYAYVDQTTGEVLHVSRNFDSLTLTDEQRETAEEYAARNAAGETNYTELLDDCTPVAQAFVERVFANGRTVTQTALSFASSDDEIEPTQQVGVCVRMDEGACYVVTVDWPQMDIFAASVYPLGWHSCIYGYTDPAEADDYPPLEETSQRRTEATDRSAGEVRYTTKRKQAETIESNGRLRLFLRNRAHP
jgi:hypothetical protein